MNKKRKEAKSNSSPAIYVYVYNFMLWTCSQYTHIILAKYSLVLLKFHF